MATGTTANSVLTRNIIITQAFRKIRAFPDEGQLTVDQMINAVSTLNTIIRQRDREGVGQSKDLWALDSEALFLSVGGFIYGEDEGLSTSILDLFSAVWRNTNGDDSPELDIITADAYSCLTTKDQTGDPEKVYLKKNRLLGDQLLYVWPSPTSVGTTSVVLGTDGVTNYQCILSHESLAINRPTTGASWQLYWQAGGTSPDTWATATDYTNGKLIFMSFKRPLYDFDSAYDNPDMPLGWENYLINRLAWEMAPDYRIPIDERQELRGRWKEAEALLFPSTRSDANTYHNKSRFF